LFSLSLQCVDGPLPLLSTWVTAEVQEAFYDAFHAEQTCQARLVTRPINGDAYQHNIELELLTLQAKMRRAQAEIELYTMAIENVLEFDNSGPPSSCFLQLLMLFCRYIDIFHWIYSTASIR
jgi:hypothetical protein